jgi:hypothetical protein
MKPRSAEELWEEVQAIWSHAPVAQKVHTLFVDDIDGSAADGTVRFGLDYEIDPNTENTQALRDALARYVVAARKCLLLIAPNGHSGAVVICEVVLWFVGWLGERAKARVSVNNWFRLVAGEMMG